MMIFKNTGFSLVFLMGLLTTTPLWAPSGEGEEDSHPTNGSVPLRKKDVLLEQARPRINAPVELDLNNAEPLALEPTPINLSVKPIEVDLDDAEQFALEPSPTYLSEQELTEFDEGEQTHQESSQTIPNGEMGNDSKGGNDDH